MMGRTLLKKIVDESFERADFVILDHALDEEDGQSAESDPGGAFDVFPTTAFESSAKIEEEGEEKPCHQEDNEADGDQVSGINRDRGEELEQIAPLSLWTVFYLE